MGKTGGEKRRSSEGAIPVAHDALHDLHGEVVGRAPADTLNGNGDVCTWSGVITNTNIRANEVRAGMSKAAKRNRVLGYGERREVLFSKLHQLLVVNTSGTNKDHAIGCIVGFNVRVKVITLDGEDVGFGAKNGTSKWLVCEI